MQLERSYSRHLKCETYDLRAVSQRSTCLLRHGNLLSKPVDPIFSMNFHIKGGQRYKFHAVFLFRFLIIIYISPSTSKII